MLNPILKKARSTLMITLLLMVTACEQDNVDDVVMKQVEQLKAENSSLKEQLRLAEMDAIGLDAQSDMALYGEISRFKSLQSWDELTLYNDDSRISVSEPDFLDALASLFIIDRTASFTNGYPYNLDSYSIELTNEAGTYHIDVLSRGTIQFPDLGAAYFDISADATALGKALLPRPDYLPKEALESRLLNSGFVRINYKDYRFYHISESRVRGIAVAFFQGEKQIVSEPNMELPERIVEVTFFLYGEQVIMNVYPEHIHIEDANDSIWYEVDQDVSMQINAHITAG